MQSALVLAVAFVVNATACTLPDVTVAHHPFDDRVVRTDGGPDIGDANVQLDATDDVDAEPVVPVAGGAGGRSGAGGVEPKDPSQPETAGAGGSGGAAGSAPVAGAAGSTDACNGNTCDAAYPCKPRATGYTCRGQFVDWTPNDSNSSFTVNADRTVFDSRSGLTWQRDLPAIYSGCSGKRIMTGDTCKASEAANYCNTLAISGMGWRLPTKAELESLVDDHSETTAPAIDHDVFPDTPVDGFWSSSALAGSAASGTAQTAWYVNFKDGASGNATVVFAYHVRCVR